MFTIKYRTHNLSRAQPIEGPRCFDQCEQLHGPFSLVSQECDEAGYSTVYAHNGDDLGMTFGPVHDDEAGRPRPMLWVMNESGATVASYRL